MESSLMSYLKDFDEAERTEPSTSWHKAERRIMQQHFVIVSVDPNNSLLIFVKMV